LEDATGITGDLEQNKCRLIVESSVFPHLASLLPIKCLLAKKQPESDINLQLHQMGEGVGFLGFMHVLSVGFELTHADDQKELCMTKCVTSSCASVFSSRQPTQ